MSEWWDIWLEDWEVRLDATMEDWVPLAARAKKAIQAHRVKYGRPPRVVVIEAPRYIQGIPIEFRHEILDKERS